MNETDVRIKFLLKLRDVTKLTRTEIVECLTGLRNLCARSDEDQVAIASHSELNDYLHNLIFDMEGDEKLRKLALQVVANCVVNNLVAQKIIWHRYGETLLAKCDNPPIGHHSDVMMMIIYNVYIGNSKAVSALQLLRAAIHLWTSIVNEKCELNFEFLHIILEHFLTKDGRITANCYSQCNVNERLMFLDYVANYLRHDSPNGKLHDQLVQFLSKMFKIQSDCLLRDSDQRSENYNAREVYSLLRCIASATGSEQYAAVYATDHSLFLNVSSLLRCLVAAGKESVPNIFTPMEKLEEVAPNATTSHSYQNEISYELKTLLMRCVANLLYGNKTNKNYTLDTQLVPTMLECTKMDARNPMLKEWSILALRNACEDFPPIQEIIAGITNKGPAQNDILNELDLSMGAMRIKPDHA